MYKPSGSWCHISTSNQQVAISQLFDQQIVFKQPFFSCQTSDRGQSWIVSINDKKETSLDTEWCYTVTCFFLQSLHWDRYGCCQCCTLNLSYGYIVGLPTFDYGVSLCQKSCQFTIACDEKDAFSPTAIIDHP